MNGILPVLKVYFSVCLLTFLGLSAPSVADDENPTIHAPIGVMGDHMHQKGEFMLSYRFMRMDMEGLRSGTNTLAPETVATTIANRFSGTAGQPPTLRVVPLQMTTDMHMIGGMYGLSDDLTLMVMANYIDRDMNHVTFQGGAGTTRLGEFQTRAKGFGDTRVGGMYRLFDSENKTHHIHANLGLSLPTGSITERDNVLAPSGATPNLRLPYAMQLGTGTYDLHSGLTYTGQNLDWSWGAQYMNEIRLESENDEGYAWGDKHELNAWSQYHFTPSFLTSFRLSAQTQETIDGIDVNIVAPVQTADPSNYGGERINLSLGGAYTGQNSILAGHEFAVEVTMPLYQNLNGVQLESDYMLTAGWRHKF